MIYIPNDILNIILGYKNDIEKHELFLSEIQNKKKCKYIYIYKNLIGRGQLIIYNSIINCLYYVYTINNGNYILLRYPIYYDFDWNEYIKKFKCLYNSKEIIISK